MIFEGDVKTKKSTVFLKTIRKPKPKALLVLLCFYPYVYWNYTVISEIIHMLMVQHLLESSHKYPHFLKGFKRHLLKHVAKHGPKWCI